MSDHFEQYFADSFRDSIEAIRFSTEGKETLCSSLRTAAAHQKKGDRMMKKRFTASRTAVIAAAVVLIMAATVFAAGRIVSIGSHSLSSYDYTSREEIDAALEDAGFQKLPEKLADSFVMDGANLVANEGMDEAENVVDSWESFSVAYKDDAGRTLYVDLARTNSVYEDMSGWPNPTQTRTIDGIEVRYDRTEHYMVPADYEVDEETLQRAEQEDHFSISYGTAEPETLFFDNIHFIADDVVFEILSSDDIPADTMFTAAEELIRLYPR